MFSNTAVYLVHWYCNHCGAPGCKTKTKLRLALFTTLLQTLWGGIPTTLKASTVYNVATHIVVPRPTTKVKANTLYNVTTNTDVPCRHSESYSNTSVTSAVKPLQYVSLRIPCGHVTRKNDLAKQTKHGAKLEPKHV